MDLEADCPDDSIYQHLLYIRHFLWSLRSKPGPGGGPPQPEGLEVPAAPGAELRGALGLQGPGSSGRFRYGCRRLGLSGLPPRGKAAA